MALSRTGKILLGGVIAAAGVGGAVYAYQQQKGTGSNSTAVSNLQVSLNPPGQNPYPTGWSTATVTWKNTSNAAVTYGVQGGIVTNGLVSGHWWTSQGAYNAAKNAYITGGNPGLVPYETSPPNRVATQTVQPGGTGRVTLTTKLETTAQVHGPEQWTFLVLPSYKTGLVVKDTLGTSASKLSQSKFTRYQITVPKVQ